MDSIFRAESISKSYSGHKALTNVSIEVPEKSIFGLLGPNGAGKTTLIRIVNQIIGPDDGQLFFNGENLRTKHIKQIGYLPEERGLYKKMKIGEQALYLAQLRNVNKSFARKELIKWFDKFDLMPWWNKKVEELSKGMQQKVQFIITIMHKPKLLIFDEPFSGFDPINANLLKEEILKLRNDGASIIFSTHNMSSVEELCDHIALINKSEKILEGNVKDIKNSYFTGLYSVELADTNGSFDLDLQNDYKIKVESKTDNLIKCKIKIPNDVSSNVLLNRLLEMGRVVSFRELLPDMNDIFIKNVTGKYPEELNNLS